MSSVLKTFSKVNEKGELAQPMRLCRSQGVSLVHICVASRRIWPQASSHTD
jgi:hypothetical protein